jgi:polar amino acid transport system substrate-binding protein
MLSKTSYPQNTIRITNGEWEPFMSEYSPHYGINSHIVSEAFLLEGITVEWGFFPWISSYRIAKKGREWDASATRWPAPETKKEFLLSEAVSNTSFIFFHLKSYDFEWDSFDDLQNKILGGTFEYDYGREFMAAIEDHIFEIERVVTDEQNFKKLLAGRIDIFPQDPIVGYAQIRNTFSPKQAKLFTHHPKEFENSTLHLIISKNSPNAEFFLDKFNTGFRKLKKSGRLAEMLDDLNAGKYDKQKTVWKE